MNPKIILLGLCVPMVAAMAPKPVELVAIDCGVEPEPASGFYLKLRSSELKSSFFFTFEPKGPGIYLPGAQYAPDWKDVERIVLIYSSNHDTGHLSLLIRQSIGIHEQKIGLLSTDCWKLGKKYLKDNDIAVPIDES